MRLTNTLQILTTGGTIDKDYGTGKGIYNFHIGEPVIGDILQELNIDKNTFDITSLLKKDSQDITDSDREMLGDWIMRRDAKKFVITHGTDTMIKTGKVIQSMITNQHKTAVLVGSSRPYSMKITDANENIKYALESVQMLFKQRFFGAFICMNGETFRAGKVEKGDDGIFRKI